MKNGEIQFSIGRVKDEREKQWLSFEKYRRKWMAMHVYL